MGILDILFVVIGLVCVAASFFLPEKLSGGAGKEEQRTADLKEAVLAELRKKENLDRIVVDALSELSERMREQKNELLLDSEAELDRMSNEKMLSFGEYSDEVLEKINQNHMEVVFLYDMLKEKESSLKDFAARLEGNEQQLQILLQEAQSENDRLSGIRHQAQELSIRLEEERRRQLRDQAEAMQRMSGYPAASGQAAAMVRQTAEQVTEEGQASAAVQTTAPGRRSGQAPEKRQQRQSGSGRTGKSARTTQGRMPGQPREASDRSFQEGQSGSVNQIDMPSARPDRIGRSNRSFNQPDEIGQTDESIQPGMLDQADIFGQNNQPDRSGSRTGLAGTAAQEEAAAAGGSGRRTQTSRPRRTRKPGGVSSSGVQSQGKQNNPDTFGERELFEQEEQFSEEPVSLEEQSDRILRMYRGGMSILEISRAMGLGQGEVKLVIDLFHRVK